jgi:hypothetical protein
MEVAMTDTTAHHRADNHDARTIADIVAATPAMGDLSQFIIDDLSPDEEAAFYRVLEEA